MSASWTRTLPCTIKQRHVCPQNITIVPASTGPVLYTERKLHFRRARSRASSRASYIVDLGIDDRATLLTTYMYDRAPPGNEIRSLQYRHRFHYTCSRTHPTPLSSFFVVNATFLACTTKDSTLMTRLRRSRSDICMQSKMQQR